MRELTRGLVFALAVGTCAVFAGCNSGGGDSGGSSGDDGPSAGELEVVEATQDDVTFSISVPSNYTLADNNLIRLWRHADLDAEIRVEVMGFPASSMDVARSSIPGSTDIVETLSEAEDGGTYQITATFSAWTGYHYWTAGTPQLHCWIEWSTTEVADSDLEWAAEICGSMSI